MNIFCAVDNGLHGQNILQSLLVGTLCLNCHWDKDTCLQIFIRTSLHLLPIFCLICYGTSLTYEGWGEGVRACGILKQDLTIPFCLFECTLHFIGSCGDPTRLPNGHLEYTNITEGSRVTFKCSPGYILSGDTFRFCQSNGQWSNEHPECISKLLATFLRLWILIAVCIIVKH